MVLQLSSCYIGQLLNKGNGKTEDLIVDGITTAFSAVEFSRWFLAIFYTCVGSFYVLRINLLTRKLDRPVTYKGEPGSLHYRTHQTFRVFRVLIFLVCLIRVPYPTLDQFLIPVPWLWQPAVLLGGCGLLMISFGGIVAVNLYMKQEWRSGIRPGEPGKLITTGPYAFSRNPMMALVLLGQLGFFLALPSAFTLVCLLVGVWAVMAQVNVEQGQLYEKFGKEYDRYAAATPAWILLR